MDLVKIKDLKRLIADMDDEADVVITVNGDKDNTLLAYSAEVNEDGDLALDTVHYCND